MNPEIVPIHAGKPTEEGNHHPLEFHRRKNYVPPLPAPPLRKDVDVIPGDYRRKKQTTDHERIPIGVGHELTTTVSTTKETFTHPLSRVSSDEFSGQLGAGQTLQTIAGLQRKVLKSFKADLRVKEPVRVISPCVQAPSMRLLQPIRNHHPNMKNQPLSPLR